MRVRMAALMRMRVIFVYTHDSIGLGEDGPTHQPIEHLASLRVIPHMDRVAALRCGRDRGGVGRGPRKSRRPDLPGVDAPGLRASSARARAGRHDQARRLRADRLRRAAPEAIVIATGSEVGIAAEAVRSVTAKGRKVRLVSMPSTNTFDAPGRGLQGERAARRRSRGASRSRPA